MTRLFLLCLILLFNLSCDILENTSAYQVILTTDKNVYSADTSTVINLKVINLGESPVYYVCTGKIYLEEYENNSLTQSWQIHGFEKCLSRNPILPESEHSFKLNFLQWMAVVTAKFNEKVSYKLKIELFGNADLKQELNPEAQFTNYIKIIRE